MSIRNGCPTAAARRSEEPISLVRARYAEPEATAPEETRTTFQPRDLAPSAASRAEVRTTGSGPVDRVTELDPILTTMERTVMPPRDARQTGAGRGPGRSPARAGRGRDRH